MRRLIINPNTSAPLSELLRARAQGLCVERRAAGTRALGGGACLPDRPFLIGAVQAAAPASTTKLTTVVALPPTLRVPKRRAPSTWQSPARSET